MKSTIGRPTLIDQATVQKLEEALRQGFSISRACELSGVGRSTYYDHLAKDKDFSDKMTLAQAWITEKARLVMVSAIDKGDISSAKWWLERKAKIEFDPKAIPLPVDEEINAGHQALREIAETIKKAYKDYTPNDPFSPESIEARYATVS